MTFDIGDSDGQTGAGAESQVQSAYRAFSAQFAAEMGAPSPEARTSQPAAAQATPLIPDDGTGQPIVGSRNGVPVFRQNPEGRILMPVYPANHPLYPSQPMFDVVIDPVSGDRRPAFRKDPKTGKSIIPTDNAGKALFGVATDGSPAFLTRPAPRR